MNGNRLYRSTSEAMIGGVASGLANYFKTDPTLIRIAFVALGFFTGGGFLLAYLAMWLLVPTAGSTASAPGDVVRENLDDMGARIRGGFGSPSNGGPAPANGGNGSPVNVPAQSNGGYANGGQGTQPQLQAGTRTPSNSWWPYLLIGVGAFFLLSKTGLLSIWAAWWPLFLVAAGIYMLSRRKG